MRRYIATFFQHWTLLLACLVAPPPLLIALLLVLANGGQQHVTAGIWVTSDPLPATAAAGGEVVASGMPPNAIEARALAERLATDPFRRDVIEAVGLMPAVERGEWPTANRLQGLARTARLDEAPLLGPVVRFLGLATPHSPDERLRLALDSVRDGIRLSPEADLGVAPRAAATSFTSRTPATTPPWDNG